VDFLLLYKDEKGCSHKIIIEYDGFKEHFTNLERVNRFTYEQYYSEQDIYRQKTLEGYGYKFLRINKFNIGDNPIETLDKRIKGLVGKDLTQNDFLEELQSNVKKLEEGDLKECPKCGQVKPKSAFLDRSLKGKYGRCCRRCKGLSFWE